MLGKFIAFISSLDNTFQFLNYDSYGLVESLKSTLNIKSISTIPLSQK